MAEYNTPQIGYSLNIVGGGYHNTLDIEGFSQMMKDPSYCYKFYWLEAIVNIISEGTQDTTFDAIIDEMICMQCLVLRTRISHSLEWHTGGWSCKRWSGEGGS